MESISPSLSNPQCFFNFKEKEYPKLPKAKNLQQKQVIPVNTPAKTQTIPSSSPINGKELREEIMANMKNDLTKMISKEINHICTALIDQLTNLSTNLKKDMNDQISDVLQTIAALNQCFNKVMDCLPPTQIALMPAHKKSRGLGIPINLYI